MLQTVLNCVLLIEALNEVYIIDNSNSDNVKHFLPLHDKLKYVHSDKNGGYGYGHNKAIVKSIDENIKYHLVLNPDIIFNPVIFDEIIRYMNSDDEIGNLMPQILYPDQSIQYLCKLLPTPYDWIGRRFNPFKSMVEKRNRLFELRFTNYDKIMEVPYLSGCFMLLRTGAIRKVGYFDENIFMYGEETDLCRRLISGGYKTVFYPKVSVVHEFQKGSHKSINLTWIGIKSAIYYFNKWGWIFDKERKKINKLILEKLK